MCYATIFRLCWTHLRGNWWRRLCWRRTWARRPWLILSKTSPLSISGICVIMLEQNTLIHSEINERLIWFWVVLCWCVDSQRGGEGCRASRTSQGPRETVGPIERTAQTATTEESAEKLRAQPAGLHLLHRYPSWSLKPSQPFHTHQTHTNTLQRE